MKDKIFGVLQRVGRSFMLPIAILPVAGLLLGIGSSFTNASTIEIYGLTGLLGEGTFLHILLLSMNAVGSVIFDNLPLLFAVGVAIGMARREKEVAALSAVIAYFVMNAAINAMLKLGGEILADGSVAEYVLEVTIASAGGIMTLQTGVFGGVIVGLGVAALHNRFYKTKLPNALSFFGGTRFVPIISTIVYMFVGILMYFVWPYVQSGISALGGLVTGSGYLGTLIFGVIKRSLIPFGLHHVFYMPFWHTQLGGTMEVAGQAVQGGQNIFFAQLADAANVTHFSSDATRFFSGEFIFMIFGLPGAALAMYHCARPEKKKAAGGLLLSAALTCMATGITEPIEFSFLFVAPVLFVVQVILAGSAYMVAHMLDIAVGLTFSGGFIDFFLFGILQGNDKTSWLRVIPVGIVYFFLYYFIFKILIRKLDLKTPGREADDDEVRLYTKADVQAKKSGGGISADIVTGLGGKDNIRDIDCCATRLRCSVADAAQIDDAVLRRTGASGVIHRGNGVQIIYGPHVTMIKSDLEDYLAGKVVQSPPIRETKEFHREPDGTVKISSPMTGIAQLLENIPDEAFSKGMMGEGVFVLPQEDVVYAPEDGIVEFVFDTKHAIGFVTDTGVKLLIHVGIDTVRLKGKGFEALVKAGDKVKKGTPLLRLDLQYLKEHASSMASPVICTELSEGQQVKLVKEGLVKAGQTLMEIHTGKK